ncbi:hypothetical protein ACCT04_14725 [Rhizobium ruizarguesonis]
MADILRKILAGALDVNWIEWAKVIFDLFKGVAWPLTVFAVVWIFRREMRERIKDIISVGPTGAVLHAPTQPAQPKPPTGLANFHHPLASVQTLIEQIDKQLDDVPEDQRIQRLVVNLAEAQIDRQFEFIFGLIFGSQILALRRLKETGPVTYESAKRVYDEEVKPANKQKLPEYDMDFDKWASFLLDNNLVRRENDSFLITDFGRDFLTFVDLRKQAFSRAL